MGVRPFGRISMVLFAAGYLAACTEVVDSVVDTRYGQYNRSTDWAKNEAILLNIIRASEYQPLNFLNYQPYTGSATASAMASSPSFIIGPNRVASQKQYSFGSGALSATATGVGTITVANLDTQNFYEALLAPVDFKDLYAFQTQGYPRELLFRLFTESVSIKFESDRHGYNSFILYNDPLDEKQCIQMGPPLTKIDREQPGAWIHNQICFEDLVRFAILSGLTSEIKAVSTASTSPGNTKSKNTDTNKTQASDSNTSSNSNTPKSPQYIGRLCFDPALRNRALTEFHEKPDNPYPPNVLAGIQAADYYPVCGVDKWPEPPKNGSTNSPNGQTISVTVKAPIGLPVWDIHTLGETRVELGTRSTFSIYNYLGRILREQQKADVKLTGPQADDEERPVLVVEKGRAVGCFVTAMFDFEAYCVPTNGGDNTKRTFSILSQLLALKTTTGDLQLQPTIRLLPQ